MASESTELKEEQIPPQEEGVDDEVRREPALRSCGFGAVKLHSIAAGNRCYKPS